MIEQPAMAGVGHSSDSSHVGQDALNQNRYRLPARVSPLQLKQKGWLFVVADGVAANPGDERGSQLAVNLIQQTYYRDRTSDVGASLKRAIAVTNQTIFKKSGILFNELSTSVVCAVVLDQTLHIAHAGDSRAYLVGQQAIKRLTTDHSFAVVPDHEADDGAQQAEMLSRKLLTRSLGSTPAVEPDYNAFPLQPDDRVLLCTQGLTHVVSDDELQAISAQHSPADAVTRLIDLANERDGTENVTAVVIEPAALRVPQTAAPVDPKYKKTASLVVTGVVGMSVLLLIIMTRGFLARDSTPSLAASLETATPTHSPTTTVAPTASATASATNTPTPSPTASSTATKVPTIAEVETPEPTDTPVEDPPEPPTPTRVLPPTPRPTATRPPEPTPTPLSPPVVPPRYPAIKFREPQFNQAMTGSSVTLEWEVLTLLPGDGYEVYYKRTPNPTWEGKCAPVNNGRCVLRFDQVLGTGSYDWIVVVVDTKGFIVSRLRDVNRFIWTIPRPEPTEKPTPCVPKPPNRC